MAYDRLLVPIDGSRGSERASRHALAIAERTGSTVDFLHVVDTGGVLRSLGSGVDRDVRDRSDSILATAEDLGEDAGVDVTTERLEGRPHEEILTYAADRGSEMVVMGRRGRDESGGAARLLGGVTDKVLRAGERPVLVVPAGERAGPDSTGYERVLLPTDGSEPAMVAAPHAAGLARRFGATVHVVSAVDVEQAGGLFDAGGVTEEFVGDLEAEAEAAVEAMVGRLSAGADLSVETVLVRGSPHEALHEHASHHDVDLVVMGAHGRSGFQRWVLGSVTDRLLRTVDVPVFVVPVTEGG